MFNIGTPELLVIAAIALIFLGPEQFPTQAKVFLRMFREFREHWDDAKRDIMNEINPVRKEFRELKRFKPEELLDKLTGESQDAINEAAKPADGAAQQSGAVAASDIGPTTGANEAPVEFESSAPQDAGGRSEETQWERKDEGQAGSAAPTEEDEYRAAAAVNDIRPKDGSD